MSEAIYRKKGLFGAYISRIGVHHSDSSKRGSRQVGSGAAAQSSHPDSQKKKQRFSLRMPWAFETSELTESGIPSPTRPDLLTLPK